MSDNERRRFQRIILDRPVSLVVDGMNYPAQLVDISLQGALVTADPDSVPAQGAHGVADIALGEDPEFMIRMQVTIRHVHDGLIGMHTDRLDLDDAARLKRLVELNIADPALLQREMEELSAF